jgi:hypothetical protein
MGNKIEYDFMVKNAKTFSKPGAAEKIAHELVSIALSHEK